MARYKMFIGSVGPFIIDSAENIPGSRRLASGVKSQQALRIFDEQDNEVAVFGFGLEEPEQGLIKISDDFGNAAFLGPNDNIRFSAGGSANPQVRLLTTGYSYLEGQAPLSDVTARIAINVDKPATNDPEGPDPPPPNDNPTAPGVVQTFNVYVNYVYMHLHWTPPASIGTSPLIGYEIQFIYSELSTLTASDFGDEINATVGAFSDRYILSDAITGYYYYFRIRAVSNDGQGAWSSINKAKLLTCPPTNAARNLTTGAIGGVTVVLNWEEPIGYNVSCDPDGFMIEQRGPDSLWSLVHTSTDWALTHTVTGLSHGTEYYFRLKVTNEGGVSPASNEISATTIEEPIGNDCDDVDPPAWTGVTIPNYNFQVGVAVDEALPTVDSDETITYSFADPLPAGITYDADEHTLTGTPTDFSNPTNYRFRATDDCEQYEYTNIQIAVVPANIAASQCIIPNPEGIADRTLYKDESFAFNLPTNIGSCDVEYKLLNNSKTGNAVLPGGMWFVPGVRPQLRGTPTGTHDTLGLVFRIEESNPQVGTDARVWDSSFNITIRETRFPPYFSRGVGIGTLFAVKDVASSISALPEANSPGGLTLTYSIIGDLPDGMTFTASTRLLSGTPTEDAATFSLVYRAEDTDNNYAELDFAIEILATAPSISWSITSLTGSVNLGAEVQIPFPTGGTAYSTGAPYRLVSIYGLPGGFSTPTIADKIYIRQDAVLQSLQFPTGHVFTGYLTMRDSLNSQAQLGFSLTKAADGSLPSFGTGTIADSEIPRSTAKTYTAFPTASGGSGTKTYSMQSIPPGMSFNSTTRVLSGTPTTIGEYNCVYSATDQNDGVININFIITVYNPLYLPSVSNSNIVRNVAMSRRLPAASNGLTPYTYALSGIPTGLSFNTVSRVLSGTPTLNGTSTLTYTVTDNAGTTKTRTFTIIVSTPLPNIVFANDPVVAYFEDGEDGFVALDFSGPNIGDISIDGVSSTVANVNLYWGTAGLRLRKYKSFTNTIYLDYDASRDIFSSPHNKSFKAYFSADGYNDKELSFTVYIYNALYISTQYLQIAPSVTAFTLNSQKTSGALGVASGGYGTKTYTLTANTPAGFPPGLSFDPSTRKVSGTPTSVGSYAVRYKATDAIGNTFSRVFTIVVSGSDS